MIAWSRSLIDAYCSSWTIIQTLEWLNCIDLKWMPVRRDWRVPLARSKAHLAECDANDDEFVDEAEQLVDVQSALNERCRWLTDEELRYCPACVQSGRHYQYQQDKRFVRCILHLERLQTGCPNCSVALDTKGSLVHGFTCNVCGDTLLKYPLPGSLKTGERVSYARVLDELHQWLKDANVSLLRYQRACSGHTSICWDGDQADSHAGTYWYALIQYPKSIVRNALAPTPASFRSFQATPLVQPPPSDDGRAAIKPYQDLLRCVARQIRRTYLKGHSRCRVHAMRSVGGGRARFNSWSPATLKPHLCCAGQAYALWLLQRREELLVVSRALVMKVHSGSEVPILLPDLHAAAASFISSFEAWVANLARIQSRVDRTNRQPMLCDPFSYSSHWALHQPGATWSCPTHLRLGGWENLGLCDKGLVQKEDHELVIAMGQDRRRSLARLAKRRRRRGPATPDIPL